MTIREHFDFPESEAADREERAHWRFAPVAVAFFMLGMLAGALLSLLVHV